MNKKGGFIAVHIGAGYHSASKCGIYKEICNKSCVKAVELLRKGATASDVVVAAISILEDSPVTNAGRGSNLSEEGLVEVDASLMEAPSLFYGAVGAAPGVANPIKVAQSLLQAQKSGPMSLGRVVPCTLVGKGARKWARDHHIATCSSSSLITEASRKTYKRSQLKVRKHKLERRETSKSVTHYDGRSQSPVTDAGEYLKNNIVTASKHTTANNARVKFNMKCNINEQTGDKKSKSEKDLKRHSDKQLVKDRVGSDVERCGEGSVRGKRRNKGGKRSKEKYVRLEGTTLTPDDGEEDDDDDDGNDDGDDDGDDVDDDDDDDGDDDDGGVSNDGGGSYDETSDMMMSHGIYEDDGAVHYFDNLGANCIIGRGDSDSNDDRNDVRKAGGETINENKKERKEENEGKEKKEDKESVLYDTVGALCVDGEGVVVAGASSGGIVLKHPGRVGQAALYGCGSWAEKKRDVSIGVTTTGCGEHLVRVMMAKECYRHLSTSTLPPEKALHEYFVEEFLNSNFLIGESEKMGGALVVCLDQSNGLDVDVLWAHTTKSMVTAHMATYHSSPRVFISRLPEGAEAGKQALVQSNFYSLNPPHNKVNNEDICDKSNTDNTLDEYKEMSPP